MRVNAALDMQTPEAHAAGLDQQAHRVFQPVNIPSGVGLHPAHRHFFVSQVSRRGVVPLGAQTLGLECCQQGPSVPLFVRPRQKLRRIGGGGVLQQRIEALQGAELLQEAARRRVFVGVHDHARAIVARQFGKCLGLGCGE